MWERKEPGKNPADERTPPREGDMRRSVTQAPLESEHLVNIGKSIIIKGELSGNEDLTIDGQVEGKVSLQDHNLTVGKHGRIQAELVGKKITILGKVKGNVAATEKVEVMEGGRLEGDITSPRLAIADGAHFRGKVDMDRTPRSASVSSLRDESKSGVSPGAAAGKARA